MMSSHKSLAWLLGTLAICLLARSSSVASPPQFNREIRPVLSDNCFACHGPDKNQRKAKLRLDVRDIAVERGAIVPGRPDQSKLISRIFSDDPDEVMPPPMANKSLTAEQKALLKQWVLAGAEYQAHWAYLPPERPLEPQVAKANWARDPIDLFILHDLEAKGITPSPEADRATLLRRLSLDLIGLPPTPEQVREFVQDRRTDAYERQVNRLLASPHFGERMAVPWLDVVRFADTVGYHGDQNLNIFPYRDYVIQSFNCNKPFNQFTTEQIAGDLLPQPSTEARVATGFNRLNMVTREGGAQDKEYLAKYAADRVRTVSMAWMGSTMGCAECHDHKFDPFTSKDFYQMEAFFADIKQWGIYADYNYTPNPDLRGVDNDFPFPPEMDVISTNLLQRIVHLENRVQGVVAENAKKRAVNETDQEAMATWRQASMRFLQEQPEGWIVPAAEVSLAMKDTNAVAGTNFWLKPDGSVGFSKLPKQQLSFTILLTNMDLAAIRLEVTPEPITTEDTQKQRRPGSVALSAVLKTPGHPDQKLKFYDAEANHKEERYSNGAAIIGVRDRWQVSTQFKEQFGIWLLEEPLAVHKGDTLRIELGGPSVESARILLTPFAALDPLEAGMPTQLKEELKRPAHKRAKKALLAELTYLLSHPGPEPARDPIRKLAGEIRACRKGHASTVVTLAREPRVTRVLPRGDWQSESGEVVSPEVPHFLHQIPNPTHRRLTRLDLANWLVAAENPLTARTIVNRLWKQFFGTGLSAVVEDLGAQGEWPVHPELLDWLACEFMHPASPAGKGTGARADHDWDIKHIIRMIVLSATYRQDSNQRRELKEVDPNNRLTACQTPRRLEAEFVRDNALFISGLLNQQVGGPSVHPYQPPGYYVNLQFPDRDYYPEHDERQYRRGIYAHWQRTFLQPMLANFDAPSREECVANRNQSNTPQQGLTLLNDPTFTEAARAFAVRLLNSKAKKEQERLEMAFALALARPPRIPEKESLLNFLKSQEEYYHRSKNEAAKLMAVGSATIPKNLKPEDMAAWTQVCRVILNLHETITRY